MPSLVENWTREVVPTLPLQHVIDYNLPDLAPQEGIQGLVRSLSEQLPLKWQQVYIATSNHVANLVRYNFRTFTYYFDLYSGLEAMGDVPFDQSTQDRVVGVLGTSAPAKRSRTGRRRSWGDPPEELVGPERDKGHFMAHAIGGGLEVNVFSQDRSLNRGWSEQGKVYREMEKYCYTHPGTFCFSRPVYTDGSSVPRWLEFGLMRDDGSLWIEVFDN
jgi:hypothetical protein